MNHTKNINYFWSKSSFFLFLPPSFKLCFDVLTFFITFVFVNKQNNNLSTNMKHLHYFRLLGLCFLCGGIQTSCVDNDYDLDNTDYTLGIETNITLPSCSTGDIYLRSFYGFGGRWSHPVCLGRAVERFHFLCQGDWLCRY